MKGGYWEAVALQNVPHLGVLSQLGALQFSRADYVSLILKELLAIKERYPQVALGGRSEVFHGKQRLSRLEVAQSSAILLNAGHLFGTYATERAVLFQFASDPKEEREFLAEIDPPAREWCRQIILTRQLHRFHAVLAAWRVSRTLQNAMRVTALAALGALQKTGDASDPTSWALRRARQLAYSRIHAFSGLRAPIPFGSIDQFAEELLPDRTLQFHEHAEEGSSLARMLDTADEFTHRTVFSSSRAAALVLAHQREFKDWWRGQQAGQVPVPDRIEKLFERPLAWPTVDASELRHFVRIELPSPEDQWVSIVEAWRGPEWKNWNFMVSALPSGENLIIDVYRARGPEPSAWHKVASQLAAANVSSWGWTDAGLKRTLWRSVARFGARLFSACVAKGYWVSLRPLPTFDDGFAYAMITPTAKLALERLAGFAARVDDPGRGEELRALREMAATRPLHDRPVLVMLGSTIILERESGNITAEIDGLWAEFHHDHVRWVVGECKTGKQGTGRAQLEALRPMLRATTTDPVVARVEPGKMSSFEFSMPWAAAREVASAIQGAAT